MEEEARKDRINKYLKWLFAFVLIAVILALAIWALFAIRDNIKINKQGQNTLPVQDSKDIICNSDSYNCDNFESQEEAQKVLDSCGKETDIHRLDSDGNGMACESLK